MNILKKRKAQITIEFLLILTVVILLFSSVTMDLADFTLEGTSQLHTNETISAARSLITTTSQALAFQGAGARKTVSIRAPVDCELTVTANSISASCVDPSAESTGTVVTVTGAALSPKTILRGKVGDVTVSRS
ncbi:MAG: hypothetical protein V1911_04110 [Candidatus Micrarchaeota archaeon]